MRAKWLGLRISFPKQLSLTEGEEKEVESQYKASDDSDLLSQPRSVVALT